LRELPMRKELTGTAAGQQQLESARARFAADVHYYLSLEPRQLPSHYFYDALGSALFDAICRLPWYAVTRAEQRLLLLHSPQFLGSNIGNFDRPGADAFLRMIRASLRPGDSLLLGADLVKPAADLLLAYDDPLGVTAAFNRNILVRINRELAGNFAIEQFTHE